jgi:hypothetical protein
MNITITLENAKKLYAEGYPQTASHFIWSAGEDGVYRLRYISEATRLVYFASPTAQELRAHLKGKFTSTEPSDDLANGMAEVWLNNPLDRL